ncbi:MAG: hypothetical protein ACRC0V_11565 [Fusobacteriaceae bacterium]
MKKTKEINAILNISPSTELKEINMVHGETGEILDINYLTTSQVLNCRLGRRVVQPFMRVTVNKEMSERYLKDLTIMELGYYFKMISSLDMWGRINYGENKNYKQGVDSLLDFSKIFGTKARRTQELISRFKKLDILRKAKLSMETECSKDDGKLFYIINPCLASNGAIFDKVTIIVWADVLFENKLITKESIDRIRFKRIHRSVKYEQVRKVGKGKRVSIPQSEYDAHVSRKIRNVAKTNGADE